MRAGIPTRIRVLIAALLLAAAGGLTAPLALAVTHGAAKRSSSKPPSGTTTTPSTTPSTTRVHGVARITFGRALLFHHAVVTVPHREIVVSGVVSPWRRGQVVIVRMKEGRRFLGQRNVRLHYRQGGKGYFSTTFSSPVSGRITFYVIHWKTAKMYRFVSRRNIDVMDDQVGPGSGGQFVRWMQHRLWVMHFYVPQTGRFDYGTGLALDAFHRLLRLGTYRTLDRRTIKHLFNGWGSFRVRFPGHGRHAEADLTTQLLALIDGSHVDAIFPISSGKPSTPTILGDYRIYDRTPGYNSEGMYYSDFFIRGYAIHGYNPAPDYPASHGCLRLDISEAVWVYNWLGMGDWVDVYY